MDVIQIKMKRDLLKMSLEYSENLDIDKDEFSQWVSKRIDDIISDTDISFKSFLSKSKIPLETRCTARLFANKTGKDQCTHRRVKDSYCKKHTTMLKNEGVLRFGDINEKVPSYDLIKHKQGILETIVWIDDDPLKQLQYILNQQIIKVLLSTPKLILS